MIPAGIISADGHVCEAANTYTDYIDPKFRDRAPHIATLDDGTEAFVVPGMRKPVALGFVDDRAAYAHWIRAGVFCFMASLAFAAWVDLRCLRAESSNFPLRRRSLKIRLLKIKINLD